MSRKAIKCMKTIFQTLELLHLMASAFVAIKLLFGTISIAYKLSNLLDITTEYNVSNGDSDLSMSFCWRNIVYKFKVRASTPANTIIDTKYVRF